MLPLEAVLVGTEKHAEVVGHVRVDFLDAPIEEQVTVGEVEALLGLHWHRHARVGVELRIVV